MTKNVIRGLLTVALIVVSLPAQSQPPTIRYISYAEAQPILQLMDDILPVALKGKSAEQQAAAWPEWVKAEDASVRARLIRGDEDTVVNFLLFGTSFTKQPRVTAMELTRLKQAQKLQVEDKVLNARLDDFMRGMATPAKNERLIFLRKLVRQQGQQPATDAGRAKLREYLIANLLRILNEQEGYARAIEAARSQGGANEEFVERSKLYRTRGLSLDTSLSPSFAIEESLKAIKDRGLLAPGSVKRVAVIGPGLDFTDKASGFDFYPEQTTQPFALVNSLLRTGLAQAKSLELTAFDLSPRVLSHLALARQKAARGIGYNVQLPHDPQANWRPEWLAFWQTFGDQIGKPDVPVALPASLSGLKLRAVKISRVFVKMITPIDLNIVLQRSNRAESFDLIVATNILVYYDVFEQSLALSNLESMLRPGGLLLSNNALLELPVLKMKSVDYLTTVYSDRADDGDHIVWYRRER